MTCLIKNNDFLTESTDFSDKKEITSGIKPLWRGTPRRCYSTTMRPASGLFEKLARRRLKKTRLKLAPFFKNVKIFGPAPAPIYFLRGRFRRRFLIKSDKNVNIQDVILNWTRKINIPNYIKLTIDIDPFSFM